MVSAGAFEYIFGYYLTIRKNVIETDDGVDYPYLKLRFDDETTFKNSGLKAVRLCYELDGPYEETLEDSEPYCSRRPIIPHYIFWNYTVEHFEEFDEALLTCFRCRMYWYSDEAFRNSSPISSPDEIEFYSNLAEGINNTIHAEPANSENIDELSNSMQYQIQHITNDLSKIARNIVANKK